jgi:hypothetical protein
VSTEATELPLVGLDDVVDSVSSLLLGVIQRKENSTLILAGPR